MNLIECPLCGSLKIKKRKGIYNFNIKNNIVPSPVIEYWECPDCGEAFFSHEANRVIDKALLNNQKQKMKAVIS